MIRDKEGQYIMTRESIQEDITIINIYAPNIGAHQNVRQMLTSMKEEININTVVGDFNRPLTSTDTSTKHKISKETQALSDTMDQVDQIDIYRTYRTKTMNLMFSKVHTEHSLGQITS